MSEECYGCQERRRTSKALGWIVCGLAGLLIVSMTKCGNNSSRADLAERRLAHAEAAEGAPIAGATGSFRVHTCAESARACILTPIDVEGEARPRLYSATQVPYDVREGQVMALKNGLVVAISNPR
jgi:hypothetical protein